MLNFSKLLKAMNEVLNDAGIKYKIQRILETDPIYPFLYVDTSESVNTELSEDHTYSSTEFSVKIIDHTTDYIQSEKLTEDFIAALKEKDKEVNEKLTQAQAGLKIIGLRIPSVSQTFVPTGSKSGEVTCIYMISFQVLHDH